MNADKDFSRLDDNIFKDLTIQELFKVRDSAGLICKITGCLGISIAIEAQSEIDRRFESSIINL